REAEEVARLGLRWAAAPGRPGASKADPAHRIAYYRSSSDREGMKNEKHAMKNEIGVRDRLEAVLHCMFFIFHFSFFGAVCFRVVNAYPGPASPPPRHLLGTQPEPPVRITQVALSPQSLFVWQPIRVQNHSSWATSARQTPASGYLLHSPPPG